MSSRCAMGMRARRWVRTIGWSCRPLPTTSRRRGRAWRPRGRPRTSARRGGLEEESRGRKRSATGCWPTSPPIWSRPRPGAVRTRRKEEPAAEPPPRTDARRRGAPSTDAAAGRAREPPPSVARPRRFVRGRPRRPVAPSPPEDPVPADATAPGGRAPHRAVSGRTEPARVEQPSPDTADRAVATGAAPPAPAPMAASADGDTKMWDQLKPSDIERAKQDLASRREEMLARHAEELRTLEAVEAQLDILEAGDRRLPAKIQSAGRNGGRQARPRTRATAADRRLERRPVNLNCHSRASGNQGKRRTVALVPRFRRG